MIQLEDGKKFQQQESPNGCVEQTLLPTHLRRAALSEEEPLSSCCGAACCYSNTWSILTFMLTANRGPVCTGSDIHDSR